MRTRLAGLLVAGSLLALALAPPTQAKPRYLRFEVSVQGQQTATWSATAPVDGCGTFSRGGSQTISFESPRPARLSLRRFPRTDPSTGKRRGFTYFGIDVVRTNWTFTRTFEQSTPPPGCPPPEPEPVAAQANDCGTQGPFEVPISVGWRGTALPSDRRTGTVELRGILSRETPGQRSPSYKTCEYDGTHNADLLDSEGSLSQRRLTSRRRGTIRVKVSAREKLPASESGSQTTTLAATVTLRRPLASEMDRGVVGGAENSRRQVRLDRPSPPAMRSNQRISAVSGRVASVDEPELPAAVTPERALRERTS